MQSIYAPDWGLKASGATVSPIVLATLDRAMNWFKYQGADLVIAGCTELSVGLSRVDNMTLDWVDPLDVMAELTVGIALGEILLIESKKQTTSDETPSYPAGSALNLRV